MPNTYALFVLTQQRTVKKNEFRGTRTERRFRVYCAPSERTYESAGEIAGAGIPVRNGPWTRRGPDEERAVGRKAAARMLEALDRKPSDRPL